MNVEACTSPQCDPPVVTADILRRKYGIGGHYYIWMLNNNLEYFFRSPTPFLKGAALVSTVSWFRGKK